jgi:hypothetical protein
VAVHIILRLEVVVEVVLMPHHRELLKQVGQVVLLEVLQLRLVVAVLEVRQLVRQELLEQQAHPLLAEQVVGEVEQVTRPQAVQVVREDFPEAVVVAEVVVHPQAVLVAMVRLVV